MDHIFIILSETWLTNGIFDNELGLYNYNIFRCDVTSILEYGSVVWGPYTVSDINQLERVQHRFLRICCFVLGIPYLAHNYNNIANVLGLPSLAERRTTLSIKFIRGLITNHIDSPCLLSQVNFKVPLHVSCSQVTFHIPTANTNYLQNEPLRRIMSLAKWEPLFWC